MKTTYLNVFSRSINCKAVLLLFLLIANFQNTNGQTIRSGAAFLKILPGARQQGLSTSTTALIDEVYAFYANPAATGFFREHQLTLTYTKWITDIYNISLNYGRPIKMPWSRRVGIALGINYQGIKGFDSSQGAAQSATASDMLITASIANPVSFVSDNLSVGANIKYLKSDLDQFSAEAFIYDFGALYRTRRFRLHGSDNGFFKYGIFSLGISVTQLGNSLTFIKSETPLPRTFRTGVAFYAGTHNGLQLQIATDYRKIKDEISTIGLGAELSWRQRLSLRGGYNFNDRLLSKYSLGLSVRLDDVQSELNNFITGRNNALAFDFVSLENNYFFSDAYRATITHIPIGPEKYYFTTEQDREYTTKDSISLTWETTQDPDLYDDIKFAYLVTQDSIVLDQFIEKTKNWEVDFFDGIPNPISSNFDYQNFINPNTLIVNLHPQNAGDYYWTCWAYDQDNHVQFASNGRNNIQHFRVIEEKIPIIAIPADTTADLILKQTALVDPIRLDIHFAFDIDTLDFPSRELLNMIGIALNAPVFQNYLVELGGHTDERGSDEYNQALSQRRVNSARTYLVEKTAVLDYKLSAVGYGESKPIYRNAETEIEHAANRRVELNFLQTPEIGISPPKVVLCNTNFMYKTTIVNAADTVAAWDIIVTDVLPDQLDAFNFNIEPQLIGNQLIWKFQTLAPGDSLIIVYQAKAPKFVNTSPEELVNITSVAARNDTIQMNNNVSTSVFVIGNPDSVIYCDSSGSEISLNEKTQLIHWAKHLQKSPTIDVCIACYANNLNSDEENLQFSNQKARMVQEFLVNWLVENANINEYDLHIHAKGYGNQPTTYHSNSVIGNETGTIVIHLKPCR